jgi:putative ABC transport system permease protein
MKIGFQLKLMLIAISKETWRMTLAVGAVALGLAAVMILMALGAGAKREVAGILSQVGVNVVTVVPERVQAVSNRGGGWYLSEKLRTRDLRGIAKNVTGLEMVTPEIEDSLALRYGAEEIRTTVKGAHLREFARVRNYRIASGRGFSPSEEADGAPVAILGSFVVKRLNGGFSMLDQTVWIAGAGAYRVVGQFEEKGLSDSGTNYDDLVVVPFETARTRLLGRDFLDRILLLPAEGADVDRVIAETRDVLRSYHGIDDDDREDFVILRPSTTDQAKRTTGELLGGLAWFLTAITLAIGGAGVFAVSYLNVLDRRGEIGLRIALGATRGDIVFLFVLEALLLSALGCVAGFLLGYAAIALFALWTDWRVAIDALVIAVPALVSALLGIVFGVLPAYKASRLTPVDALRSA